MPRKKRIPPCPGKRSDFTLVKTSKGYYWRHKRFTFKPMKLNKVFEENARRMGGHSKMASLYLKALAVHTSDLNTWMAQGDIISSLAKQQNEKGYANIEAMAGIDLQPDCPLKGLMYTSYNLMNDTETKEFHIDIALPPKKPAVKVRSKLFSGYRFIVLLIYGQISGNKTVEVPVVSSTFTGGEEAQLCRLTVPYGRAMGEYMLCLRVECFDEGDILSLNQTTRGMAVLSAGMLRAGVT